MRRLIDTVLAADAGAVLFARGAEPITAGQIRGAAARAKARLTATDGDIALHTASAARFVAGLLAVASLGRRIVLPANTQAGYLSDIGASEMPLLSDDDFPLDREADGSLPEVDPNPTLVFFTSGSTGAPKPVIRPLVGLDTEGEGLDALWRAEAGRVEATVSHQHIYGLLFRISWPVISGRVSSDTAAAYWEELEGRLGPETTLISSPAHLTRLTPGLRPQIPPPLVFSSGQALPWDAAVASAETFGQPPIEVLGSTETGGVAWRRQTEKDAPWTPFAAVTLSTADDGALLVRSRYFDSAEPHRTGDGMEMLPDGRFHLRPRMDRVAKVDGKRVSLARVEEKLAALPEIATAAALVLPKRKGALAAVCALTPAGRAALEAKGPFRLSRDVRAACDGVLEPAERPKHWRFLEAIPVNPQGKRVLATLEALFDDPLDVLALDVRSLTDETAEVAFRLAPELVFFRGHFPGLPILPGVAQTHIAAQVAERLWGFRPSPALIQRLKFRRVLRPEDEVVLKLVREGERLQFEFLYEGREASRGEIG
jgi:3-hydroxymyristoyl/3-hydroxydecanoyl-(acyl carrier protein) dehydratase